MIRLMTLPAVLVAMPAMAHESVLPHSTHSTANSEIAVAAVLAAIAAAVFVVVRTKRHG